MPRAERHMERRARSRELRAGVIIPPAPCFWLFALSSLLPAPLPPRLGGPINRELKHGGTIPSAAAFPWLLYCLGGDGLWLRRTWSRARGLGPSVQSLRGTKGDYQWRGPLSFRHLHYPV